MKLAIIIIRPERYYQTKQALADNRFYALSSHEIFGRGKKPVTYMVNKNTLVDEKLHQDTLTIKRMLEIYIRDEEEQRLIDIVLKVNQTNNEGDGKIFIIPCTKCVRVHTDEMNEDALM